MRKQSNGTWVSTSTNLDQEWKEVVAMRNKEMLSGEPIEAANMALTLLTPLLHTFNLKSAYSNSESIYDFLQDAYLLILKKLPLWDENKESFATFIYTHLQGVARDIRNGELSEYQIKVLNGGIKILSSDMLQVQNADSDKEITIEFADEKSVTEDIYIQKQEYKNSQAIYKMFADVDINELPEKDKKQQSAEFACMNLFLGGYHNFSEAMLNDILSASENNTNDEKEI